MSERVYLLDDGSTVTARELAAELNIHVASARKRLRGTNVREKVFEVPRCRRGERVYTRDGINITATDICLKFDGLTFNSAGARALKWERGELSMEQMLLPKGQYRGGKDGCRLGNKGNAEWQALGSKPRNLALAKIKGAGQWEIKQMEEMEK